MRRVLRAVTERSLPGWAKGLRTWLWLSREAARLRRLRGADPALEVLLEAVMESAAFRPQQRPSEILRLLQLLRSTPPRRILEIGGRRSGTLLLFTSIADSQARLLSIDLGYSSAQCRVAARLGTAQQEVACVRADSHAPETVTFARQWFRGEQVDFLFIDGDHSYDGVTMDLALFGPLVQPGGIVAFHDIVPDSTTRYGVPSPSFSGEVPRFWRSLASRGLPVVEFVEDPNQDGMGIGAIRVTPDWMKVIVAKDEGGRHGAEQLRPSRADQGHRRP